MNVSYIIENSTDLLLEKEIAQLNLSEDSNILNIACEFILRPECIPPQVRDENIFGIEVNKDIVRKVSNIKYCDVDTDRFPFDDDSFDLVLSIWGMEHFQNVGLFKEGYRVLKKGGRLIFLAPNAWSPFFVINRIFGTGFAGWYYRNIIKSDYHPHRAYYRFNSYSKIQYIERNTDFRVDKVVFFGPSNIVTLYLRKSRVLQMAATLFERLITNRLLFVFKPYIICVLTKDKV